MIYYYYVLIIAREHNIFVCTMKYPWFQTYHDIKKYKDTQNNY